MLKNITLVRTNFEHPLNIPTNKSDSKFPINSGSFWCLGIPEYITSIKTRSPYYIFVVAIKFSCSLLNSLSCCTITISSCLISNFFNTKLIVSLWSFLKLLHSTSFSHNFYLECGNISAASEM